MTSSRSGAPCNSSRRRLAGRLIGLSAVTWALSLPSALVAREKGGVLSVPFRNQASLTQAPFGNQVTNAIRNYNRVSPYVATAGLLHRGGLQEVVDLGFKVLIDLRGAHENGVAQEARQAARMGLRRLHLPVTQAALGAEFDYETLDGTEELTIPAGTQTGKVFRLRGRGVPDVQGRGRRSEVRGDLLIEVVVDTPTSMSAEEEELLRKLAEVRGDTVSGPGLKSKIRSAFR